MFLNLMVESKDYMLIDLMIFHVSNVCWDCWNTKSFKNVTVLIYLLMVLRFLNQQLYLNHYYAEVYDFVSFKTGCS